MVGSVGTTWDSAVQRATGTGARTFASTTKIGRHEKHTAGAVRYIAKTSSGARAEVVFRDSDFAGFFGARSYYGDGDKPIDIEAPSVRTDQAGASAMLHRMAQSRLFRFRRPPQTYDVQTGIDQHARTAGDIVGITHGQAPDAAAGTRGATNLPAEIVSRALVVDPPRIGFDFAALGFGAGVKIGRISPSGSIASSAGPSGGNYTLTLRANRYTETDAIGGLPVVDAAAFSALDVVCLLALDGGQASATTQIVQSVSGNDVVVNGNFGGALANDLILVFAQHGAAASQQTDGYVYLADAHGNGDIGTSGDDPWRFGE